MGEARNARKEARQFRDSFDQKFQGVEKDLQDVRRLREVFSPQQQQQQAEAPNPVEALEAQIDYYLEQAMEAKAKGTPMPLTTNAAIQSFQNLIQLHQSIAEFKKEIAELKSGMNQANDPNTAINNHAYTTMDNFLQNSLDAMYGNDPNAVGVKQSMYGAASARVVAHIKELQRAAPAQWERIRRNGQDMQRIVNAVVRDIIPPKAMQIIEQDELQNTEMSTQELWKAWREADSIKNPQERQRIRTMIRRDLIQQQMPQPRRRRR